VKIEITGVRPGEKLFEELYLDSESINPTAHPQVFCLRPESGHQVDPAVQMCLDRLGTDDKDDPALEQGRFQLNQLIQSPAA